MRIIHLFLFTCLVTCPAFAENLVLMNGTIIDGTGKPRVIGNLRIRDGKIAEIGPFKPVAGETLLDVKGMIIAPGFVGFETVSAAAPDKIPAATLEILPRKSRRCVFIVSPFPFSNALVRSATHDGARCSI